MNDFVNPRFEEDAIAALMEEAFSETRDDKFDVEKFIEGDLDYWWETAGPWMIRSF